MNRFTMPFFSAAVIITFLVSMALLPAGDSSGFPLPGTGGGAVRVRTQTPALPAVGSFENLKALLKKNQSLNPQTSRGNFAVGMVMNDRMAASAPAALTNQAASAEKSAASYSTTNVQVQGVDEADIVKTDGKYIYQVNNRQIRVFAAYPADRMKTVSKLSFEDVNFTPREIYLDKKYLVVIGSTFQNGPLPPLPAPAPAPASGQAVPGKPAADSKIAICPPIRIEDSMKTIIYDISDPAEIKKLREAELSGSYVSSRKIGASLYLVANKNIDWYWIMQEQTPPPAPAPASTPAYRDTAGKGKFVAIGYPDIRYFPDSVNANYLMVAGLNLDRPDQEMQVDTYLGAGENIYASQDNLYVAVTQYPDTNTKIYKFAMDLGRTEYKSCGEVPGTVLNQYSMDESQDSFRIATTAGNAWSNGGNVSRNNVYILDAAMKTTGRLEDIAPGERIYSVRFMGDRAYMVTFKQVDPLFVIDLKDPKAPKILGALKIPGYSDYLHPYDENHIIGFGKDTEEMAQKGWPGNGGSMAFYQGMKLAVFDVSDVTRPIEEFKAIIGDRGTDSELLRNPKALLFDKSKNLLAFPVTVMENKQKTPGDVTQYGEFTFQGAYVYNLDLQNGFKLKGKITHLSSDDYLKAGQSWYDSSKNIERILYINDTLYTLSKGLLKANDLDSLKEIGALPVTD